jgi:hypothetical protein
MRKEETRMQEELVIAGRQKTRQIQIQLEKALDKAVRKGVEKLEGLWDDGLWWKRKYSAEKEEVRLREEQLLEVAVERRERVRVGRLQQNETLCLSGSCGQNWTQRKDKRRCRFFACLPCLLV